LHYLLTIGVSDEDRDMVGASLWTLGVVGVEDLGDHLRAAFTDHESALRAAATLGTQPIIDSVDDHIGLDSWREFATWTEAGPFVICPAWITPPDGADVILIDPGHSFGSGSHPTTRLAVAALAPVVRPGMNVLDVGCGSGVLSIVAARLGAFVTAVDTDPSAVEATLTNTAANDCSTAVEVASGGPAAIAGVFDLIVVNVTIDIHDSVAAVVDARLDDNGILVASGVLAGAQERRLVENFPALDLIGRITEAEWVAVTMRREGRRS